MPFTETEQRETNGHTPGPWYARPDATPILHTQLSICSESGGERIATVFSREENARLIASAPDMLKELKRCQELIERINYAFYADGTSNALRPVMEDAKPMLHDIRATVARAEGK